MGGDREVPVASATAWSTHYMTPAHRHTGAVLVSYYSYLAVSTDPDFGRLAPSWDTYDSCSIPLTVVSKTKSRMYLMVKWDLLFSLTQLHLRAEVFSCLQWFFKNEVLFEYRLAPNDFAPGSEIQMNPYNQWKWLGTAARSTFMDRRFQSINLLCDVKNTCSTQRWSLCTITDSFWGKVRLR